MQAEAVDGMDVLAVEAAARKAVDAVRAGTGPFFLECKTYRFRAHSMYDPELYRSKAEVEEWKKRDPIPQSRFPVEATGTISDSDLEQIERDVAEEIDGRGRFCRSGNLGTVGRSRALRL